MSDAENKSGSNPYLDEPKKLHDENKYVGINPEFLFKKSKIVRRKKRYKTIYRKDDKK